MTNWDCVHPFVQQEGEGTVSAMVVEKQKLDNKVKELKDRVQVGEVTFKFVFSSNFTLHQHHWLHNLLRF